MHHSCFSLPTLECAVPFQKMLRLQLRAPRPPLLPQGLPSVQRLACGFRSGAHLDPFLFLLLCRLRFFVKGKLPSVGNCPRSDQFCDGSLLPGGVGTRLGLGGKAGQLLLVWSSCRAAAFHTQTQASTGNVKPRDGLLCLAREAG